VVLQAVKAVKAEEEVALSLQRLNPRAAAASLVDRMQLGALHP
jgi:hypothetical protein